MYVRFPTYASLLLFTVFFAAGCDSLRVNGELSPLSPAASPTVPLSIAAEPANLRPEFRSSSGCPGRQAFGVNLTIIVRGGSVVILSGLRFEFFDRFGTRGLPQVNTLASPGAATSIPTSSPIPFPGIAALPGAAPITIPGLSPVHGLFLTGETVTPMPFFLAFGCGLVPQGTLVVIANGFEENGFARTAEMRLVVGS